MQEYLDQGQDAWKKARIGLITASVAAGCLRLNNHMSAAKAFRLILGIEKEEVNPFMQYGIDHEQEAREKYEELTGKLVIPTGLHVHPEQSWLASSPDGLVYPDGLLEIKCLMSGVMPVKIPVHHRVQMLVQMACTGRKWVDYFVWHPSGHYLERCYPQGLNGLVRKLHRFYVNYIVPKIEPPRKKARRRRNGSVHLAANDHPTITPDGHLDLVAEKRAI